MMIRFFKKILFIFIKFIEGEGEWEEGEEGTHEVLERLHKTKAK